MKTTDLHNIMMLAWQFFRQTGKSFSTCLQKAWVNFKLLRALHKGIIRFYFQKVDGSIREAWGTLNSALIPSFQGYEGRSKNATVQVFFDTEKQEFRCYKKFNLVEI